MVGRKYFRSFLMLVGSLASAAFSAVYAEEQAPIKLFTHGYSEYGRLQPDGNLKGKAIDDITCAAKKMDRAVDINIVPMVRVNRMQNEGRIDLWFPTYDVPENNESERLAGMLGEIPIYWFLLKDSEWDVKSEEFKANAKTASFPTSAPDRHLIKHGFNRVQGTDDENRLFLKLLNGEIDAVLAMNFLEIVSDGLKRRAEEVRLIEHAVYPIRFEVMPRYHAENPAFVTRLRSALASC